MSRPVPRIRSATPWREPVPAFPAALEALAVRHGEPWPINETEIDLPSEPPPVFPTLTDLHAPLYIGSVTGTERGIPGPLNLDIALAVDGASLDFGPFHFDQDSLRRLNRLFLIIQALVGQDRPTLCAPRPRAGEGVGP